MECTRGTPWFFGGVCNNMIPPYCVSSAWDLLTNQEVNIERLALAFPDHFGHFLENQAVANRLEIEGQVMCVK